MLTLNTISNSNDNTSGKDWEDRDASNEEFPSASFIHTWSTFQTLFKSR